MAEPNIITCRLELPPLLQRLTRAPERDALAALVASRIAGTAASLGLELRVACGIAAGQPRRVDELNDIRLHLGARRCRFTREQLRRAYACAHAQPLGNEPADAIAHWLRGADDSAAQGFICDLVFAAIARDPSMLADAAPQGGDERHKHVVRALLTQGISIAGLALDLDLIAKLQDETVAVDAMAEAAIAALRARCVEIHLPPADLRGLTSDANDDERGKFQLLRDELFFESGLRVPALRLVENETLAPRAFAFKINGLLDLPWFGLAANEILVNGSPERVGAAILGPVHTAANPVSDAEFAVIPAAALQQALAQGWTAWRPLEYLSVCLGVELRRSAPRLFDQDLVASELERLAEFAPRLVRCVQRRMSIERVVAVLRQLAAEGISVLDLRRLLAGLVDFEAVVVDPATAVIVDDRIAVLRPIGDPPPIELLTAAARKAQRRRLTYNVNRTGGALTMTRVDPAIGRMVLAREGAAPSEDDETWCDQLLDRLAAKAPTAGLLVQGRCLMISSVEYRAALRRLVAQELPQFAVLAIDDLAPGVPLQFEDPIEPADLDAPMARS